MFIKPLDSFSSAISNSSSFERILAQQEAWPGTKLETAFSLQMKNELLSNEAIKNCIIELAKRRTEWDAEYTAASDKYKVQGFNLLPSEIQKELNKKHRDAGEDLRKCILEQNRKEKWFNNTKSGSAPLKTVYDYFDSVASNAADFFRHNVSMRELIKANPKLASGKSEGQAYTESWTAIIDDSTPAKSFLKFDTVPDIFKIYNNSNYTEAEKEVIYNKVDTEVINDAKSILKRLEGTK
jgi:hypothetical protein